MEIHSLSIERLTSGRCENYSTLNIPDYFEASWLILLMSGTTKKKKKTVQLLQKNDCVMSKDHLPPSGIVINLSSVI